MELQSASQKRLFFETLSNITLSLHEVQIEIWISSKMTHTAYMI
jgi:hypothetical protein